MRGRWCTLFSVLVRFTFAAGLSLPLLVQTAAAQTTTVQAIPKSLELYGKLGTQAIQMHLEVKPEEEDGWRGYYVIAGKKILLAGEADAQSLGLEESENGVDVSGQWEGKWEGKLLRGIWSSEDGVRTLEFVLEVSPVQRKIPRKASASTLVK